MPVGNERVVRAGIKGIKSEPLINDAVLKLIVKSSNEYAKKRFNMDINCGNIDELEACLVGAVDKYPTQEVITYGVLKGESLVAGATGVIGKRVLLTSAKHLLNDLGVTAHLKKEANNLFDVLSKYKSLMVAIGYAKDSDISLKDLGEDGVEVTLSGDCTYLDTCLDMKKEGIYNVFGQVFCTRMFAFVGVAENVLGNRVDIKILEYNPPNCKARIFEV